MTWNEIKTGEGLEERSLNFPVERSLNRSSAEEQKWFSAAFSCGYKTQFLRVGSYIWLNYVPRVFDFMFARAILSRRVSHEKLLLIFD
jgi:hypothetical protein